MDFTDLGKYLESAWLRHQMETFSALLAICAGNSPVPGELPAQRPVTRSFDVFCDPRLNNRLSKQSLGWWFETLSRPLWRHRNGFSNSFTWIFPCSQCPFCFQRVAALPYGHHDGDRGPRVERHLRVWWYVRRRGNGNCLLGFTLIKPGQLDQ